MTGFIHPSADVEEGAVISEGVSLWQWVKVRTEASIGPDTSVGGGAYVGKGVRVGARCKVQNLAQLFEGTQIGDNVFVGPGAILANDKHPRATTPEGRRLNEDGWKRSGVIVGDGASIGAGGLVLPGVSLGAWCVVGAGAVVTRNVDAHSIVTGSPARHVGLACVCGHVVEEFRDCESCGRSSVSALPALQRES